MASSTEIHGYLAHQFDDLAQQRMAATLGMWSFLMTEVLFFGGMFAGYLVYRYWYPHAWGVASRHLDLIAGTINTAVLLTSSLTMAFSVDAAKQGKSKQIRRMLLLTMVLGVVFLGIKGYEYYSKWLEGHVPGPYFEWHSDEAVNPRHVQLFFSFYFAMTGWHALHMVIGFGLLSWLYWQAGRGEFSAEYHTPVENIGLYWHFVDIVWVFLFPLLYLVDRS